MIFFVVKHCNRDINFEACENSLQCHTCTTLVWNSLHVREVVLSTLNTLGIWCKGWVTKWALQTYKVVEPFPATTPFSHLRPTYFCVSKYQYLINLVLTCHGWNPKSRLATLRYRCRLQSISRCNYCQLMQSWVFGFVIDRWLEIE